MSRKPPPPPSPEHRRRGFESAAGLVAAQVRAAGEARGFAAARLLTHWAEIVGEDLAAVTRPVRVGHGREGLGGTLTVLVAGAHAPVVEMQKDRIRTRVNACCGWNAVARVVLTQTGPAGFAEGQTPFAPSRPPPQPTPADPAVAARAAAMAEGVRDAGFRDALETLARNVLSRTRKPTG